MSGNLLACFVDREIRRRAAVDGDDVVVLRPHVQRHGLCDRGNRRQARRHAVLGRRGILVDRAPDRVSFRLGDLPIGVEVNRLDIETAI